MNILSLGEKIKKLRKEKNMTLKELAGDRITAAQISHIERDKSHTSRELLEYLASQLDVSVDYLLETKEMQSKKLTDNLILQGEILIKCNDLEKAEDQLNEAIKICDEYKVLDNYATCNFLLADINFKKGKYSESVMGYEKALYYFIKNNDKDKLYKCYLNIGKIYMIEEFYKGAILQFEFSEGILNEIQVEDVDIYKDLYSKMAYCYIKLDNNEKSLDYINKMDEIDIKNNPEEELDVLILKANNFLNVGEFEKSKEYFKKALEILDKEKNKTELASIYLTISEIYKSVGKLDRSLEYSQRVYDIKKSDEDEYMMKSLFRIIETYISNYKYDMAKKYCKIALASSIKNKNRLNEYRVLKYYSDMHKAQNENIIAIEYLHKCINIISELNDENRSLKSRLYQKDIDQSKLNRLESENRELKDLMSIKNSVSGSKQVVSEIIDRNYGSWDQEFVIDKGSSDGISDSMFVLSSGGVIGVVESIEKNSSKVKLLVEDTISSQHLTFKIESQGQSIFALLNGYDEKTGEFRLLQIGDPVEIKKGSLVSTSGLGKYKSSDLPLGTVTSTQKASDQLGQEIRVKPKANLDVNRYVLLIGE